MNSFSGSLDLSVDDLQSTNLLGEDDSFMAAMNGSSTQELNYSDQNIYIAPGGVSLTGGAIPGTSVAGSGKRPEKSSSGALVSSENPTISQLATHLQTLKTLNSHLASLHLNLSSIHPQVMQVNETLIKTRKLMSMWEAVASQTGWVEDTLLDPQWEGADYENNLREDNNRKQQQEEERKRQEEERLQQEREEKARIEEEKREEERRRLEAEKEREKAEAARAGSRLGVDRGRGRGLTRGRGTGIPVPSTTSSNIARGRAKPASTGNLSRQYIPSGVTGVRGTKSSLIRRGGTASSRAPDL